MQCTGFTIGDFNHFPPTNSCSTNSIIEMISGDARSRSNEMWTVFDAPYSPDISYQSGGSTSSSQLFEENPAENVTRHTIVPDFCIYQSDYPGVFPLVIELKPANEEFDGIYQNTQQMLSKLFFQDVVFGIVITTTGYHLSSIVKTSNGVLRQSRTLQHLTKEGGELDVDQFKSMCNFVFSVLKWSDQTKCSI